jgi:hypothetical protein
MPALRTNQGAPRRTATTSQGLSWWMSLSGLGGAEFVDKEHSAAGAARPTPLASGDPGTIQ